MQLYNYSAEVDGFFNYLKGEMELLTAFSINEMVVVISILFDSKTY